LPTGTRSQYAEPIWTTGWRIEHTEVKQGCLSAAERLTHGDLELSVWAASARGVDQRSTAHVELCTRQLIGANLKQPSQRQTPK
jgi:hypothetical protein